MDFAFVITTLAVNGLLNALCFYLGARLSRGEPVLPPISGKLEVIDVEEPEEKYNEIWPGS